MATLSRRDFIKLAASGMLTASGFLGLAGLLRFLSHPAQLASPTEFDLGPAENYPVDSRTLVANGSALLLHTESGFRAISLVCPHLGCTVESDQTGFACPCHGSEFNTQGAILNGPAKEPLRALRIERSKDEHLILHTDL